MNQAPQPIEVQKYLSGMDYPTTKDQIVEHAREHDAPQEIMEALQSMPEQEYDGPNRVSQAVSQS